MGKNDKDREDLLRAVVIAYCDPVQECQVLNKGDFYYEGRILYSDKEKAVGFLNGWKVIYKVKAYKFRRIIDTEEKRIEFIRMIKNDPVKYPGAHHINFYYGLSRKFKAMVKL